MPETQTETKIESEEKTKEAQSPDTNDEDKSEARPVTDKDSKTTAKKPKEERAGIAYIKSTSNNTMIHITDLSGNTISKASGGMVTKHSRLKANPTIAMFVAKKAAERAKDLGINALYVRTRGKTAAGTLGPGSHAAIKSLGKEGFRILNILDAMKYARGGPKKKGGRRGRRV
jgi:small subunit ribosomal protein S11